MQFSSLLIANRGEIAVRIIRTAKALGLRTIAVYSDADAEAVHVRHADDAVFIGPSAAMQSYLDGDKILAAARQTGAQAIHPGYGFLSENAGFAAAVEAAGLVFVGPPHAAIDIMGDKARSKRAMIDAGIPCLPGYEGEQQDEAHLIAEGIAIGFPLMVKATAGGGGRGMRLVESADALPDALKQARSEAHSAFGNGDLILEKAVAHARHVEIQIFADAHGNVIHLGERDCSTQRRHQKIIEEAPCPALDEALRANMGAAAIKAAQEVHYRGAGTVEFMLDDQGGYYFLEMNTRLQVEHPVTELVTGFDLVALQLEIAAGKPLGIGQDDVVLEGHAMEVRLYAEDASNNFLPSTGHIDLWHVGQGPGIRVDAGVETGSQVSEYYDPMIAKIMAHGPDRDTARRRLIAALRNTALFGPSTNRDFLIDALQQPVFAAGEATTDFIGDTYGEEGFCEPPLEFRHYAAAALMLFLHARQRANSYPDVGQELLNWTSAGYLESGFSFAAGEQARHVRVQPLSSDWYRISDDEHSLLAMVERFETREAFIRLDEKGAVIRFFIASSGTIELTFGSRSFKLKEISASGADIEGQNDGALVAPMHGLLLEVAVSEGDVVKTGDRIAVLEAMKMQHVLTASVDGTVSRLGASAGDQIAADELIAEISTTQE